MNDTKILVIITVFVCNVIPSSFVFPQAFAFEIDQVATCTYVYDGDSFETTFAEIRLADIDAPEMNDTSRDALAALILNQEIYLDIDDISVTDPYDRYVCVTYVEVNATHLMNVNYYLVEHGYAWIDNFLNNEFDPYTWVLYYPKESTIITCVVSPSSIVFDESVTVSGVINPSRVGVDVTIYYTSPDKTVTEHQVVTTFDGSYTDTVTTAMIGSWTVNASWSGDAVHLGATSISQPFAVTKRPSSLSCTLPTSSIEIGENITATGLLLPMRAGELVTIMYRHNSAWSTLTTVTSGLDGHYAYTWTPSAIGSYQLQATWPGDPMYAEASSTIVSLAVTKLSSTLICKASATSITIGNNVTLHGEVSPLRSGIDVTLQYQTESGWTEIQSVTTDTQSQYMYLWTPSAGGTYQLHAICSEDDTYTAAISTVQSITVEKLFVDITCTVLPVDVEISHDVSVSGSITPAIPDVTVTLQYTAPNASTITDTAITNSDGNFTDTLYPDAVGGWSVGASWAGDAIYDEAVSTFVAITVTESSLQISPLIIGISLIVLIVVVAFFVMHRR